MWTKKNGKQNFPFPVALLSRAGSAMNPFPTRKGPLLRLGSIGERGPFYWIMTGSICEARSGELAKKNLKTAKAKPPPEFLKMIKSAKFYPTSKLGTGTKFM